VCVWWVLRPKQSHGVVGMQAFGLQLWKLHFLIVDRAAEAKYQKKLERRYPVFHFLHGTFALPSLSMCAYVCARECNVYARKCVRVRAGTRQI
jgi:hypothetical protein